MSPTPPRFRSSSFASSARLPLFLGLVRFTEQNFASSLVSVCVPLHQCLGLLCQFFARLLELAEENLGPPGRSLDVPHLRAVLFFPLKSRVVKPHLAPNLLEAKRGGAAMVDGWMVMYGTPRPCAFAWRFTELVDCPMNLVVCVWREFFGGFRRVSRRLVVLISSNLKIYIGREKLYFRS